MNTQKSFQLDMTKDYEDAIKSLQDIRYYLQIQGREEESELIKEALDRILKAKRISSILSESEKSLMKDDMYSREDKTF